MAVASAALAAGTPDAAGAGPPAPGAAGDHIDSFGMAGVAAGGAAGVPSGMEATVVVGAGGAIGGSSAGGWLGGDATERSARSIPQFEQVIAHDGFSVEHRAHAHCSAIPTPSHCPACLRW